MRSCFYRVAAVGDRGSKPGTAHGGQVRQVVANVAAGVTRDRGISEQRRKRASLVDSTLYDTRNAELCARADTIRKCALIAEPLRRRY